MIMKISPSLLAADFANLQQELERIQEAGADMLHLDVMDGVFVPNISFGMPVIAALRKVSGLFFDVHIMITDPGRYLEALAQAGADLITFHVEAASDPAEVIRRIKALGVGAGLTLRPGTPVEAVLPFLPQLDLVLVMTVEPGFGGQRFMADMMPKLRAIRAECHRLGKTDLLVQVDGGVGQDTIALCAQNGANCFVAGSAVFGKSDYTAQVELLRHTAQTAYRQE